MTDAIESEVEALVNQPLSCFDPASRDDDRATDHLTRAYMLGGPEAFQDEDPALIEHLRRAGIL